MKKIITKLIASLLTGSAVIAAPLVYQGEKGIGKGKHIVFIANDHEYRSEETCPLLAKILAKHHGFKCTVLFGINDEGHIQAGDAGVPVVIHSPESAPAQSLTKLASHIAEIVSLDARVLELQSEPATAAG